MVVSSHSLPIAANIDKLGIVSANEVIEQIRQLPREEQKKVVAFVHELETVEGVSEEFKRMADEVFTTNAELFRKLAQ